MHLSSRDWVRCESIEIEKKSNQNVQLAFNDRENVVEHRGESVERKTEPTS